MARTRWKPQSPEAAAGGVPERDRPHAPHALRAVIGRRRDPWDEWDEPEADEVDRLGEQLALREARPESIHATEVHAERSAIGRVTARDVRLYQSATLLTLGQDVRARQSAGGVMLGAKLSVERGGAKWLVGGLVQAKQVFAVAVIAARVEGQVRCLFDVKGAFAFGAGMAIMSALLRLFLLRDRGSRQ
ncbi:MAG: hypothetical protein HY332_08385 [Chloroflexi bacterium]|nr:hypothetical protein [Chloroflexota bacterium]